MNRIHTPDRAPAVAIWLADAWPLLLLAALAALPWLRRRRNA